MKHVKAFTRVACDPNVFQIGGFCLISAGVSLVHVAAGLIVGGVLMCAAGLGLERDSR
jgi:transketolase C-terminal domain/subunit